MSHSQFKACPVSPGLSAGHEPPKGSRVCLKQGTALRSCWHRETVLPRTGKSGEGTCSDREYNGTDMSSSSSLEFSKWVPGPAASVGRDLLEMQILGSHWAGNSVGRQQRILTSPLGGSDAYFRVRTSVLGKEAGGGRIWGHFFVTLCSADKRKS